MCEILHGMKTHLANKNLCWKSSWAARICCTIFSVKINIIITTYSTASKSLGSLVETQFNQQNININSYSLIIDEINMLLNNISFIEVIHDFVEFVLILATIVSI